MTTLLPTTSLKGQRWVLPPSASAPTNLSVPPLIASLLAQRGLTTPQDALAFLQPEFKSLHDPSLLPNMAQAVARIARAISEKQKIVIFSDYDVDGITGAAMLWHTLKAAGANVHTYIPHRIDEGYGLSAPAISQLCADGAQLIITVDCGITGHQPIALAKAAGVDLIVTDHHELPAELPDAHTIVHPRLPCDSTSYPNTDLCGAGVAYKLCWALATHFCNGQRVNAVYKKLLIEFSALAALATIADVVPLLGENRVLVKYGLAQLPRSSLTGLQALIAAAGYTEKKIDGIAVGFGLAPRLNAAGRMDHADMALELLTSATPERAKEIAEYLETQNQERQATEREMAEAAKKEIDAWPNLPHVLVLSSKENHAGVVGIVASRLVDTYHRPAFVLSCEEKEGGECHGSARSIAGFDIHRAIEYCRPLLISGGGHAMAGGVKLLRSNLDAFRTALNEYAQTVLTEDHFIPQLHIDGEVTLAQASLDLVQQLTAFEPHGRGNPHPRFLLRQVKLTAPPRLVGSRGAHAQFQFAQNSHSGRGIAFKLGPQILTLDLKPGMLLDLVVEPRLDHFTGTPRVDFIISDLATSH